MAWCVVRVKLPRHLPFTDGSAGRLQGPRLVAVTAGRFYIQAFLWMENKHTAPERSGSGGAALERRGSG